MKDCFEYCTGCGLCHSVYDVPFEKDDKGFWVPMSTTDSFSRKVMSEICPFGKMGVSDYSGSVWGKYILAVREFASDEDIRYKASSGGVITSVAAYLLKQKMVDGVILTKADPSVPYHCVTICAKSEKEIVDACGSRYSQSAPLMNILQLIEPSKKYAVIGKPCDIAVLRRYMNSNSALQSQIQYLLSFFCAGMPSDRANQKLLEELECSNCVQLRYRGYGWPGYTTAIDNDGTVHRMEYKKSWMDILGRDIRKCCKFCFDGIGEAADISCGDLWNLKSDKKPDFSESKGYNIVFARTQIGIKLLKQAIEDGVVQSENWETKLEELRYCQPNHYIKRTTILGKILALKILNKPAPKYSFVRMLAYAKKTDMKTQIGSFKGTIKRSIHNKL